MCGIEYLGPTELYISVTDIGNYEVLHLSGREIFPQKGVRRVKLDFTHTSAYTVSNME